MVIVSEGGPNNLDLHGVGANIPSQEIAWNCYDRLIGHEMTIIDGVPHYDRDRLTLELAEDMRVDAMSVTFRLRSNATFQDGTPVTAADVKWSLDRAVSVGGLPTSQMRAGLLERPEQFVAVDDRTVRIDFLRRDRFTVPNLATIVPGIYNAALVKKNASAGDPWGLAFTRLHTAGSGPFKVTRWTPGVEVVMERNDTWQLGPLPKAKRIVWRMTSSAEERRALLESGEADICCDLPFRDLTALRSHPDLTVISVPVSSGIQYLGMNVTKPPFDDVRVRQAIAYALPYEKIMDSVLFGFGTPMFGRPTGQETSLEWPQPHGFSTDLAKAKDLLAQAGYRAGLETVLAYDSSSAAVNQPLCSLIQQNLAQVGVTAALTPVTGSKWRATLNDKTLPLYTNVFSGWLDYPEYFFFWCYGGRASPFNTMGYQSTAMDDAIAAARTSGTEGDRARYERSVRASVDLAFEDVPRIPLFQPSFNAAMRRNVGGYRYWFHRRLDYRTLVKA